MEKILGATAHLGNSSATTATRPNLPPVEQAKIDLDNAELKFKNTLYSGIFLTLLTFGLAGLCLLFISNPVVLPILTATLYLVCIIGSIQMIRSCYFHIQKAEKERKYAQLFWEQRPVKP